MMRPPLAAAAEADIVERAIQARLERTLAQADAAATARTVRSRYYDDPVAYGWDKFGIQLWGEQARFVEAVARSPRTAVKSGHKTGKSTGIAVVAWWWADTRAGGRVICSSTTDRQVRGIIWKEVKRMWRAAQKRGTGADLPEPAELPHLGVQWPDGREIVGFTARQPEAMAGYSGDEILFLIDEASGVPDSLFDAIEGNLAADGARIALFSNPTQVSGRFYDAFNRERAEWETFTVRSVDTPNARTGRTIIKGLAGRKWCQQRARVWGVNSARYNVRVLGNFPDQGDDTIIPMALVDAARKRWDESEERGWSSTALTLFAGLDPARYGDDEATFVFRDGMKLDGLEAHLKVSMTEFCRLFVEAAEGRRIGRRVVVRVDTGGLGGAWSDHLRYLKLDWLVVEDVSGSSTPADPSEHFNLRAELWFGMAGFLEAGGMLPPDEDDELDVELGAVKYVVKQRGEGKEPVKVESKDELRKAARLGKSPGRADCCTLAAWRWESGDYAGGADYAWESEGGEGYRSASDEDANDSRYGGGRGY